MNMLRRLRITFASFFLFGITLMLLDITGASFTFLSWMAKIQLLPALLSATSVSLVIVAVLVLITFLFGRIYCSVICPLGIMQDVFTHAHGWIKGKKNRFSFRPERPYVRYSILIVFGVLLLVGLQPLAILLAPYSAYGRIVQSLFAPLYAVANNWLAAIAEHYDSYAFYSVDVYIRSLSTLIIALLTFLAIAHISFYHGRWWCSTVCPVGTLLGSVSRYALYRPVIDTSKCNACGLCEKRCKAECIDPNTHSIDTSRCVDCFDCMDTCRQHAISFTRAPKASISSSENIQDGASRRRFLGALSGLAVASAASAADKVMDGGLAYIEQKRIPERATPIKPAGALSLSHFQKHCTACQLCVSACPSHVLRPSSSLLTLMQPEMSFERGYCDISCTACADVCPTGAITRILPEDKTAIRIGHAVWIRENCVVLSDHVSCGNCAKHCPAGAITLVDTAEGTIPAVDTEKCIGCGTCEYLCPSRPLSAIYVEGQSVHQTI